MNDKKGFYYSAIDADSEGEEGKFYFWTKAEIRATINQLHLENISKENAFIIACHYFSIPDSKKENDEIVLQCNTAIFNDSSVQMIEPNQQKELIDKIKSALEKGQSKEIIPILDAYLNNKSVPCQLKKNFMNTTQEILKDRQAQNTFEVNLSLSFNLSIINYSPFFSSSRFSFRISFRSCFSDNLTRLSNISFI